MAEALRGLSGWLNLRFLKSGFALRRLLTVLSLALVAVVAPQSSFAQSMTLPGKFSVASSGAATYSIPIAVPPGTAGLAPSLSIEYDSHGGNGLLGMGWSLGGLPSIGRCPQTVAQDGALGAVTFASADRFCMDGQRLVLLSGTYGADGAQYRTEVETFSEIISHGTAGSGPAWFEVHTKSGQIMQFGNTTDSQILAKGTSTARSWALNKVSDTKGNYFTVTYTNDATNGQAYPIEIGYTGNAAANLSPNNKVQFVYAMRPDITSQYQAGAVSKTTVRLTDVETFAGASLVADYKLAYQQSTTTQNSLLSSVTLCASDGSCLPATNLSWQAGGTGFSNGAVSSGSGFVSDTATNDPGLIPVDLNGDGKTDFVQLWNNSGHLTLITYLSKGDGTFTAGSFDCPSSGFDSTGSGLGPGIFTADLNGDGRTDLVQQWNNSGHVTLITYISRGDGTFTIGSFDCPTCGFASTTVGTTQAGRDGQPPIGSTGMLTADLNGDGRTDIIQQWNNSGHVTLITYLSNGDGTFKVGSFDCPSCGFDSVGAGLGTGMVSADLNGDGKTDLIQQWNNAGTLWLITYLSNGDGTFSVSSASSGNGWTGGYLLPADLNGDGRSDLVQQWNNSGVLWFITYLSKGDGTFVAGEVSSGNGWTGGYLLAADLNGDGKADLVQQWDNSGTLWLITYQSNGDGTFISTGGSSGNGWTGGNLFAADLNGDGKSDLVQPWNNSGPLWFITYLGKSPFPDLLTTIAAGIGASTSITYLPITNGAVYSRDSTASYPQVDVQSPVYVVSQVSTSNGVGGTYSSNYAYAGAKLDLSGRGFLGFRQMTVNDPQTGITDITNYLQTFPYLGLVSSTTRSTGSQTLAQSSNTFQFSNVSGATTISPSSAPYQVSLSQNVSSGSDLDGSTLPTVTTSNQYDTLGNATQVAVSTSDGYGKTTNNTYTNDTTNWFLGRLTASTVTAQAPQQLGQYCALPWGGTISNGQSVTAYSAATATNGQICSAYTQTRTCTNGTLSGSFAQQACTEVCSLPWGGTINSGQSATAYSAARVPSPQTCTSVAQTRTCSSTGTLSGSFTNQTCVVVTPKTIVLSSGTSWTVPSDWNSTNNKIEVIGGGGGGLNGGAGAPGSAGVNTGNGGNGGSGGSGGAGGGGGAYSLKNNVVLTPNTTIAINIGTSGAGISGGDTYFNGTSCSVASTCAKGGATGGTGGAASSGVGDTKFSGGNAAGGQGGAGGVAGNTFAGGGAGGAGGASGAGGGGGGAGGPHGAGGNASGSGGGTGDAGTTAAATNGTEFTSAGSGGGANAPGGVGGGAGGAGVNGGSRPGGSGASGSSGGVAGSYGAGGAGGAGGGGGGGGGNGFRAAGGAGGPGGAGGAGSAGKGGLIVITYTPAI